MLLVFLEYLAKVKVTTMTNIATYIKSDHLNELDQIQLNFKSIGFQIISAISEKLRTLRIFW